MSLILTPATDEEKALLSALAGMCLQYVTPRGSKNLEHQYMSAGEAAVHLLAAYGLVDWSPRGGTWTEAGMALLCEETPLPPLPKQ
jgi:hypothetical protein